MLACLQLACLLYRRGKDPGKMLSQAGYFAILGNRVRVCITTVQLHTLLSCEYFPAHLRQRWSVDKDKIC